MKRLYQPKQKFISPVDDEAWVDGGKEGNRNRFSSLIMKKTETCTYLRTVIFTIPTLLWKHTIFINIFSNCITLQSL